MIKNKPVIGILPTYNLVNDANDPYQDQASFVRMYEEKIYECGGIPIGLLHQNMYDYLPLCDGYLWPGGSKVWPDFFPVLEDALKYKKPVLGVCLGLQAIGTFFNLKEAKEKHPEKSLEEAMAGNRCLKSPYGPNKNYIKFWDEYLTSSKEKQISFISKYFLPTKIPFKRKISLFINDHSYMIPKLLRKKIYQLKPFIKKIIKGN